MVLWREAKADEQCRYDIRSSMILLTQLISCNEISKKEGKGSGTLLSFINIVGTVMTVNRHRDEPCTVSFLRGQ